MCARAYNVDPVSRQHQMEKDNFNSHEFKSCSHVCLSKTCLSKQCVND